MGTDTQGRFSRLVDKLAANLAKENYTVHLFDLNGFGYSGGKRFNPDHTSIFRDFFSVIKLMTRNIPLIGKLTSLRARLRGNLVPPLRAVVQHKDSGDHNQLYLARPALIRGQKDRLHPATLNQAPRVSL